LLGGSRGQDWPCERAWIETVMLRCDTVPSTRNAAHCTASIALQELVLRIDLPGVRSAEDVSLKIGRANVVVEAPGWRRLDVRLPHDVDRAQARARFDVRTQQLEVTMRTLPAAGPSLARGAEQLLATPGSPQSVSGSSDYDSCFSGDAPCDLDRVGTACGTKSPACAQPGHDYPAATQNEELWNQLHRRAVHDGIGVANALLRSTPAAAAAATAGASATEQGGGASGASDSLGAPAGAACVPLSALHPRILSSWLDDLN
jgi:hypothetical protein